MVKDTTPPAYIGNEPPPPAPPIQVLVEEKPKRKFPLWLIILLVVCFWLSLLAMIFIYFMGNKDKEEPAPQSQTPSPAVVTVIITETPGPASGGIRTTTTASKKIFSSEQFGYSLETPKTWVAEEDKDTVWIHDGVASDAGKIHIMYHRNTDLTIVPWFDLQFPQTFGRTEIPIKKKVYVNKNGVETLETETKDPQGRLRYYFIANKQVISFSFTTTNSDEINKTLQVVYGQIIDSISVKQQGLSPSPAPSP